MDRVNDFALQNPNAPSWLVEAMREVEQGPRRNGTRRKSENEVVATREGEVVATSTDALSLLDIRPLPAWLEEAATKPTPRRLFGDLWYEGELSSLFAETNVGKSILAVQIGDAITRGRPVMKGFPVEVKTPVLLLDFELSAKQFHTRCSAENGKSYAFAPGFLRAEINPDFDFDGEWAMQINEAIEAAVVEHGVRVVIVDNITYLRDETERAKGASPLMRHLNALKRRHGLSILVIAHTPKRDPTRPIGRNDLAGSRRLLDFCDSCFALGESHRDARLRYLKQIKVRQTEFTLDSDNVAVLSLAKRDGFLRFDLEGFAPEQEHLKARKEGEDDELEAAILDALHGDAGTSYREIARRLGTNHTRVKRVADRNGVEHPGTPGTGGTPRSTVPPVPSCSTQAVGDGYPDEPPVVATRTTRGQRVRTPRGEGEVLQSFAKQITVRLDGSDRAAFFDPFEVEPLEPAPF
jgi:hypothetical protein